MDEVNDFFIFRIKSQQHKDFFINPMPPLDIIINAIKEYENQERDKDQIWIIGDSENIGDEGLYFAFGKKLKFDRDTFDEENKKFDKVADIRTPHAYVFISFKFQVCAIALNTITGYKPQSLANKLATILSETDTCVMQRSSLVILAIEDTDEFMSIIDRAEFITKLHVTFDLPNPVDVDKFHKEMEEFLGEIKGKKGEASATGDSLDKAKLRKVTNSVNSTGNSVRIKAKLPEYIRARTIHMSGNQSIVQTRVANTKEEKKELLRKIEKSYHDIRGGVDD